MKAMVLRLDRRVKCKLRQLRRTTKDKGMAVRCQIVLLADKQRSRVSIADSLGCSVSWVRRVIGRFCELGISGLIDRREDNGQGKLDEHYLSVLHGVVAGSPQQYGYTRPTWTRELLAAVMESLSGGVRVHVGTMSRALRMIRARRGRPRPVLNCCPWPKARQNRVLAAINAVLENLEPSEAVVYLDEVDIHLNPKIGLDWMNRGQQKLVVTPGTNAKRYVCGAEDANSGELTWVLADKKNSLLFIATLRQLLRRYPAEKKVIHVILDNYSIHDSGQTRAWLDEHDRQRRIRLHFLPPYCPQHNRIERLWLDLHAQVTRNHTCRTIEELVERVVQFLVNRNRIARNNAA